MKPAACGKEGEEVWQGGGQTEGRVGGGDRPSLTPEGRGPCLVVSLEGR